MAEEIKDAGKTVPRAMIGAYLMNGALGVVFLISYMFMITDVQAALDDASGYPHIWVFTQTVSSGGGKSSITHELHSGHKLTRPNSRGSERNPDGFDLRWNLDVQLVHITPDMGFCPRPRSALQQLDRNGQQEAGNPSQRGHGHLFDHDSAFSDQHRIRCSVQCE